MEHVAEWSIHAYLFTQDDSTLARVVLQTGANTLRGEGAAYRSLADPSTPEVVDELAVGRALIDLGNRVLHVASGDIAALRSRT